MSLDHAGLLELLNVQDGAVSRRQVLDLGGTDHDLARLLRRRDLVTVHPGVYVDHTGRLSWIQRAWCAVHARWPAALARESALPEVDPRAPIHLAVDLHRHLRPLPGVVLHRTPTLDGRVNWLRTPPRIKLEHAILDVMGSAPPERAYRALAALCHTRTTTPAAIRDTLRQRPRVPNRQVIDGLLDDLETGACSVLERGYLRLVERRHRLPPGDRQVAFVNGSRRGFHDVKYSAYGLVVELDGRAFHDSVESWNDSYSRDLEVAVTGARTARLSYRQIFDSPCLTAHQIGRLLHRGGWAGAVMPCPDCP